ncbi:hypothetical protein CARUB_v10002707mg [Capsella rubella]|uniref:F-box domain-containing protein n=1 Tax=Capsella rubella TaxID=81985 RepID=R0FJ83_9BRAS|nr:F-box/kelch-repeat protein At3g04660 [Capsella rubella]EOA22141.1 hypothetical protein CARUB_v10002707mg [Capsella rubella]
MKRVKNKNDPEKGDGDGLSSSLTHDLIEEILARLPSKTLVKFTVVSKLWSSTIRSKYFIDTYLKQSLSRRRFLFTFPGDRIRLFHSISRSQEASQTRRSSIPMSPDERVYLRTYDITPPVRGLICVQDWRKVVISNPSTGQFLVLPKVRTRRRGIHRFFGYDPIRDEYKVLCMTVLQELQFRGPIVSEDHQVFTLNGDQTKKKEATWRKIRCELPHCPVTKGVCSNGVVYYGAWPNTDKEESLVVAFDVRLEKFTPVKLPVGVEIHTTGFDLVSYQRKHVALVNQSKKGEFEMWVLEDVGKARWSKISLVVPSWNGLAGRNRRNSFCCRGVVSSGEFIFSPVAYCNGQFRIISYNREEDIARSVEIEGLGENLSSVSVFLDYGECPVII